MKRALICLFISFIVIANAFAAEFVVSKLRRIYHYPSCHWAEKISQKNLVEFDSVADAKSRGFRACKVCTPPK